MGKRIGYVFIAMLLSQILTVVQSQVVSTRFGNVRGSLNGSVYEFLGIPYARPPVDSLRWKPPRDPEAWSGLLDATAFAPVCPQKNFQQGSQDFTLEGDEDCLHLNIWTPQTGRGNLPVMVFIHGGGNQQGGASEIAGGTRLYSGKNLAGRGNVVVVTIQYRIGPLGFLVHPGLEAENARKKSGNYAVLDQILALRWIRNNIGEFGGDTTRVMIFGESAGGVNVGNLLVSPLAGGLFQRAGIQSASPVINDYLDSRNKGIDYVNTLTTGGTDLEKIATLRSLPADSLVKSLTSPLEGGKVQLKWQPVLDDYVFKQHPINAFQSGFFNKVPLLIGSNSEEMSLSAPTTVVPSMVTALINLYVPAALRQMATQLYPPGSNAAEARRSYVSILTDAQFTATVRRTAECVSLSQDQPVWRYFFTHRHTLPLLEPLGSYHGMELFYVFNNWENATAGTGYLFRPEDDSVQRLMLNYWVNFAATGNPNGSKVANWTQYQAASDCFEEINSIPDGSRCGLRTAESDLWDAAAGFLGCRASGTADRLPDPEVSPVYPNPTRGRIEFAGAAQAKGLTAHFFDIAGHKVLTVKDQNHADLTGLSPGIYLMKLVGTGLVGCYKIILQ